MLQSLSAHLHHNADLSVSFNALSSGYCQEITGNVSKVNLSFLHIIPYLVNLHPLYKLL